MTWILFHQLRWKASKVPENNWSSINGHHSVCPMSILTEMLLW
jgi:hypothetical protein